MSTPFDKTTSSIPVVVVATGKLPLRDVDTPVLTLEPALHEHPQGADCPACVARGDIRAMLFDLMTEVRLGMRKPFETVIVDARQLSDPKPVVDRLDPSSPALAFRDHTVARSFHLSRVI